MFVAVISKDRILSRLAPSHQFAAYGGFAACEPQGSRLTPRTGSRYLRQAFAETACHRTSESCGSSRGLSLNSKCWLIEG